MNRRNPLKGKNLSKMCPSWGARADSVLLCKSKASPRGPFDLGCEWRSVYMNTKNIDSVNFFLKLQSWEEKIKIFFLRKIDF